MATTQVTLTKHFQATGQRQNGDTWTRNDFKTADDLKFQTFDGTLASKAKSLLNVPVTLTYEPKERGQFVNNEITDIEPVTGEAPAPSPVAANGQPTAAHQDLKQDVINRSAGLARAIEFLSVAGEPVLDAFDNGSLFELANTFARFFETGEYGAASSSSDEGAVAEGAVA